MFRDEHQTSILMELKARTAKYEDASQLAKYLDALKLQGKKDILMWLVATSIPQSVREFLDRIGIEYTEIHESEYRAVALRHGEMAELLSEPSITESVKFSYSKSAHSPKPLKSFNNRSYSTRSRLTPKFKSSMERLNTLFPAAF